MVDTERILEVTASVATSVAPIVLSQAELSPLWPNNLVPRGTPPGLLLPHGIHGVFFGLPLKANQKSKGYVGRPMNAEGHCLCVGPPGTGKTQGIVKGSILKWAGAQVIVAVKGDLVTYCERVAKSVGRPIRIISLTRMTERGIYYDPLDIVRKFPDNVPGNVLDIATALLPYDNESRGDKIWVETAQEFLAGALIFYLHKNDDFITCMEEILQKPIRETISRVMEQGGPNAKTFMGRLVDVPERTINSIGMELSKLARFCAIPAVRKALTPSSGEQFSWLGFIKQPKAEIVVLDFPENMFDQCAPLFRLVINQMVKAMEHRPERTYDKFDLPPILVQLDEFARFSKIPAIRHGLATLRSRGVTFELYVQSIASLDSIYGQFGGREIRDNIAYYVIMGAMDVESQKYLSTLIGSAKVPHFSADVSLGGLTWESLAVDTSLRVDVVEKPMLNPALLRNMDEPVIVCPQGAFRVGKKLFATKDIEDEVIWERCRNAGISFS